MNPKIYYVKDSEIDPTLIDVDALYILEQLHQAGHIAYLVGGSVRDLLTKRTPKDFDISTSARPEQIKAIFQRRCLLIGRRFRLAHIRFGHKIIEVSTFRTGENDSDLIIQDNEWGTPEEDVLRRDFTVNGLFYDAVSHTIIDYVGGWEDIHTGILRTIGAPEIRFKQDPVRLLRLLKFQARFGFAIAPETEQAIAICREELQKSSQARILEEILRMLESGASELFFKLLAQHAILNYLFPLITQFAHTSKGKEIFHYLTCVDKLHHSKGKNTLDRSILASCLVFSLVEKELDRQYLSKKQIPHIGEITMLTQELLRKVLTQTFTHFPRRISAMMITLIVAQYRLTPLNGKKHYRHKLFHFKDFELSLQFLRLRAMVNASLVETYSSIRQEYREYLHQGGQRHHHHGSSSHYRERKPHRRRSPTLPQES